MKVIQKKHFIPVPPKLLLGLIITSKGPSDMRGSQTRYAGGEPPET